MSSFQRALVVASLAALVALGCDDDTDDPGNGIGTDTGGDVAELDADPGDVSDIRDAGVDVDAGGDVDAADGANTDGDAPAPDTSDSGSSGDVACMTDDMCPGNFVCENGSCRGYTVVQIRDVTRRYSSSAREACNEDASGADLFELELQGPFGKPVGYAEALRVDTDAQTNTDASTVFDGSSNSLEQTPSGSYCPSGGFGPSSVLSLGCGGSMVVVFSDGAGNLLRLEGGQRLVVHEYGEQCCDSDCPEEYWEVRVCSAESPQRFQNESPSSDGHWPTCETQTLGVGSGRDVADLRLPRP